MKKLKEIIELVKLILKKRFKTLAGSISFFFLINGGTALYLTVIILKSFNVKINLNQVAYLPESILSFLEYFLNNTKYSNGYSLFFIATSVWGASNLFYQMIETAEIIYERRRPQTGAFKRVISILFMLIFIFFFVGSWFVLSFLKVVLSSIQDGFFSIFVKNLVLFFLPFLLILYINVWIPPIKPNIKKAIPGAVFTSLYWFISTFIFGIYVKYFSNLTEIYGALTLLLISILYLYILTNGLIIGFIINYNIQKKEGNI